jgi:hypothetical protein
VGFFVPANHYPDAGKMPGSFARWRENEETPPD